MRVARVWEWGGGEHDEEVGGAGAGAVAVQVVSESELVGMLFGKEEGRSGTACVRACVDYSTRAFCFPVHLLEEYMSVCVYRVCGLIYFLYKSGLIHFLYKSD